MRQARQSAAIERDTCGIVYAIHLHDGTGMPSKSRRVLLPRVNLMPKLSYRQVNAEQLEVPKISLQSKTLDNRLSGSVLR